MSLPRLLCAFIVTALLAPLFAKDVQVRGYTRKDGTYVAPHVRTAPNSTKSDNYSTKGNVNPYTGKTGTKPGDASAPSPSTASASTSINANSPGAPTPSSTVTPNTATTTLAKSEAAKPGTANLSLIKPGMTKSEVVVAVGKPNIETKASWFYVDRGFVRFTGDKVSGVEAR